MKPLHPPRYFSNALVWTTAAALATSVFGGCKDDPPPAQGEQGPVSPASASLTASATASASARPARSTKELLSLMARTQRRLDKIKKRQPRVFDMQEAKRLAAEQTKLKEELKVLTSEYQASLKR